MAGDIGIISEGFNTYQLFEARGTSSDIDVTAETISNTNGDSLLISSYNPEGGFIDIQSDPDSISISSSSKGHLGFGIEFSATHSNADIVFYSSDFLLGSFDIDATNMLFEGYDSVTLETVDDDDAVAEGEFTIRATLGDLNYNGRRVLIETTQDGDIYFANQGSDLTAKIFVGASDSVNIYAYQQSALIGTSGVTINSRSLTTLNANENTVISSNGPITISGSSAAVTAQRNLNINSANAINAFIGSSSLGTDPTDDTSFEFYTQNTANFVSPQITFSSRSNGGEPLFQPLDVTSTTHLLMPFRFLRVAGVLTGLSGTTCGFSDEIVYSPVDPGICYCTGASVWRCYGMS